VLNPERRTKSFTTKEQFVYTFGEENQQNPPAVSSAYKVKAEAISASQKQATVSLTRSVEFSVVRDEPASPGGSQRP
jgi:hypothetical protein